MEMGIIFKNSWGLGFFFWFGVVGFGGDFCVGGGVC